MIRFIATRLLGVIPQLLLISLLAFVIIKSMPGDPVPSLVGGRENMTLDDYERVRHNLGLDQPLPVQYGLWLNRMVQGDWGYSLKDGRKVQGVVLSSLKNTLILVGSAWVLIIILGIYLGYLAGANPHTTIDYSISGIALVSFSIPPFWLGLMLILMFSVGLGLFPSSGMSTIGINDNFYDLASHLVLPVATIVLTQLGPYLRLMRGSIRDTITMDYIRAARSRGIRKYDLIFRHLMPNALTPFITWVGFSLPLLIGSVYVVEWVFGWPGIGRLFLQSAIGRNYPVLMACTLVTGILIIAGNLLADCLIAAFDPRLRRQYVR